MIVEMELTAFLCIFFLDRIQFVMHSRISHFEKINQEKK